MSIEYLFFDNQVVTATMMNNVISKVLTAGVENKAVYADDTPYNISELNGVFYANLSEGIVPETVASLKVSVTGKNAIIQDGTCFFADGSHAAVVGTETVPLLSGNDCYIVMCSDAVQNKVYAKAVSSLPSNTENVVVLAHVALDKTVTDLRRYAKGKVPSMYASDTGLNGYTKINITEYDKNNPMSKIELNFGPGVYSQLFVFVREGDKLNCDSQFTISKIDLNTMETISFYNESWYDGSVRYQYKNDGSFRLLEGRGGGSSNYWILNGKINIENEKYVIDINYDLGMSFDSDDFLPQQIEIFAM